MIQQLTEVLLGTTVDWQRDGEGGACPLFALNLDVSTMFYDKTIANGQTKPDAFHTALCGKEGIEYFMYIFFFDPDPGL